MSENEIKSIIKKYRNKSTIILMILLLIAIAANWLLINNSIARHSELGLPFAVPDLGFVWGTIIIGLMSVLHLCFHFFERILIDIFKHQESKSV